MAITTANERIVLAIVGSRHFTDEAVFLRTLAAWIDLFGEPAMIVSGGARGADTLAEAYVASNKHIGLTVFEAEWDKYGKAAGPMRNAYIVAEATHVLAFPDKRSKGTLDTIERAKAAGLNVTIRYV